jgi:methylamine dehydrogenase heavy chain
MLGKLTTSDFTSALSFDKARGMIYAPGSFYSRRAYGERTDVVVFHRVDSLSPATEVVIPTKLAAAGSGGTTNLMGGRFLGVYNMTPAMSVSIVDVENRKFVQEIATAGCALVYPVPDTSSLGSAFVQLCGDGTLQVVNLDRNGKEGNRQRSKKFFDVEDDPVYDYAARSAVGWILVSFAGQVFETDFTSGIGIADPWTLLTETDRKEKWQLGGSQPIAYNAVTGTLFTLMHQGKDGVDTHEADGKEVWAYDLTTRRRGYRIALAEEAGAMNVTADAEPLLLVVSRKARSILVYDARTGRLLRTIAEAGFAPTLVQRF